MSEDLKRCPKCNSNCIGIVTATYNFPYGLIYPSKLVMCMNCKFSLKNASRTEKRAIKAWNRRGEK